MTSKMEKLNEDPNHFMDDRCKLLRISTSYGVSTYKLGNAYGHIAIGVSGIQQVTTDIKRSGVLFSLEPTRLEGSNEIIAFLTDPDGYQIELIERPSL